MDINQIKQYNPNFSIAFRKETYYDGSKGFIFIVPEIWGNQTFLKNELLLITDIQKQFGVQQFLCEGAFYEMPSSYVKTILQKPADEIIRMFNAGQLKAQEFLALTTNESITINGADTEAMYNDQNAAYYAAREIFPSIQPFFKRIYEIVQGVIDEKYSADTVAIFRKIISQTTHEKFDQEITEFARALVAFAQKNNIPLSIDDRFRTLLLQDSQTNSVEFRNELQGLKNSLISTFSNEDPDDSFLKQVLAWQAKNEEMSMNKILSLEYNELFALYQRACLNLRTLTNNTAEILAKDALNIDAIEMLLSLAFVAKIDERKYPKLFEYSHQRVLYEKTVKGSYHILGGYVDEVLVDQLLNKLQDKGLLRNVYKFLLDMYSIEQLFKTEMLPEQAKYIPYLVNKYSVDNIMEFLADLGVGEEKLKELEKYSFYWDQTIARTKRFYDNAFGRSNFMVNNCIQKVERSNQKIAVLMVGGFHVQPIVRALLRRGDYSFMVLQCQIGTINTSQGRSDYDKLMDTMNKH